MPMEVNPDIPILAYGKREDPRDVILFREGTAELKAGSVVGTSSRRRELQIKRAVPGMHFQGYPRKRADPDEETLGRGI